MAEIDRSLIGVWGPSSTMKIELGKMAQQSDLVEIVAELKQVVCVKG